MSNLGVFLSSNFAPVLCRKSVIASFDNRSASTFFERGRCCKEMEKLLTAAFINKLRIKDMSIGDFDEPFFQACVIGKLSQ